MTEIKREKKRVNETEKRFTWNRELIQEEMRHLKQRKQGERNNKSKERDYERKTEREVNRHSRYTIKTRNRGKHSRGHTSGF